MGIKSTIKNFLAPIIPDGKQGMMPNKQQASVKDLRNYMSPVQLQRLKHDVGMWRAAMSEAELAYYPHRVKQQRLYIDTVLNGHAFSVMERRKELTLLRDFEVVDQKGNPSEVLTEFFSEQEWFNLYMEYVLDAKFFGYSLISLGDCVNDAFPDLGIIKRWHISPDRHNVTSFIYSPSGADFTSEPYSDWHIWVPTPSENGQSVCGYGLFYKMGLYEIFLRNTLGFNGDFVELYSQPYRVGKTTKTSDGERAQLEQALQRMGSNGYAIIDPMDEIQFLETQLGGTGWQGYDNLEQRCEKKISKIVLGHADAVDSIPGKLGGGQNPDDPVQAALRDKQTRDGRFLTANINVQLFPKLRKIGFVIPDGYKWRLKNDKELRETRVEEDKNNLATATVYQTIKNAGGKPDWKQFTERTGIKVEEAPDPAPMPGLNPNDPKAGKKPPVNARIQNKLNKLYKH